MRSIRPGIGSFVVVCSMFAWASPLREPGDNKEPSKSATPSRDEHGGFTGEVKLVFYVQDVRRAVEFYRGPLGFTFHHYHDYRAGKSVREWTRGEPPIYAEMSAGGRRFGIHRPTNAADERRVGGVKAYYRVKDLDAHHRRVTAWKAEPSPIQDKPWMRMFHVTDPDGNRIYFAFTEDAVHGNPWAGKPDA